MSPKPDDSAYSIDVDLGTQTVEVAAPGFAVELATAVPAVEVGVPGLTGPTGLVKVAHGADPNVARPAGVPLVYWVGTVQPTNADPDDLLLLKGP